MRTIKKSKYISFDGYNKYKIHFETDDKYVFSWNESNYGWIHKNSSCRISRIFDDGYIKDNIRGYVRTVRGERTTYVVFLQSLEPIANKVTYDGGMIGRGENKIYVDEL
jgi:hypothetical protein